MTSLDAQIGPHCCDCLVWTTLYTSQHTYRRSALCIHKVWPRSHCSIPPCITQKTLTLPQKVQNSASPSLATKAMPMKRYSRKGRPALVSTSSSVLALPALEEGPMVCPTSVSVEAASMSSRRRLVFPSCSHPPSPRLLSAQNCVDAPGTQQAGRICLMEQGWRSA